MDKRAVLLKQDRYLFHTQDLALLWGMQRGNTLYTTIKRYVKKGILHRIHKGFYSTLPPERIDPILLGIRAIHRFAYLSTESVLVEEGAILQEIAHITLVSDISTRFELLGNSYRIRKMKEDHLMDPIGLYENSGVLKATPERALADLLYFHPNYYLDRPRAVDRSRLKEIQETLGDR